MALIKVKEEYDGRLPVYHVVREISTCDNCNAIKDEIVKTFDTYEDAVKHADSIIEENRNRDRWSPCGEEIP